VTTPRYREIADELRQAIKSGAYQPGDVIPKEKELMARYKASRPIVRQAIGLLRDEGLLMTIRRRGTVVRRPPVRLELSRYNRVLGPERGGLGPWETSCKEQGVPGEMKPISVTQESAACRVAEWLEIPEGETVVRRSRHAIADGQVAQIQDAWYPLDIVEGTPLASAEKVVGGAYRALAAIGHRPSVVTERVIARAATPEEAQTMRLGPSVPVLEIWRQTRDQDGRAVEVLRVVADANRSELLYDNMPLPKTRRTK